MIQTIVSDIWSALVHVINEFPERFSREKSIVFTYGWLLKERYPEIDIIDFERRLFENFSDGEYLDLYFIYNNKKIGVEFKFPKRSINGNSNQTQTRIKIINDIKRLSHLVNTQKIDYGVFLLATDEKPYIFTGNKTLFPDFSTYNNVCYKSGLTMPIHTNSKEIVLCTNDITFNWRGIENNQIINKIAWIDPIILNKIPDNSRQRI